MVPEKDGAMAMGNTHKKFGEDWTCGSKDMIAHKHRQTDILITILCSPIGGGVITDSILCLKRLVGLYATYTTKLRLDTRAGHFDSSGGTVRTTGLDNVADMSGQFGPIKPVPKCLSAESSWV